jgi:hypothetical protein
MKHNIFFAIFICMNLMLTTSCEKADIQKLSTTDNKQLELRNVPDDCSDCPGSDCCCAVRYLEGDPIDIHLCGTTTGVSGIECGPVVVGNCTIEGFILAFSLDENNMPIGYFCMAENTAFYIRNRNTSGNPTKVRVSCQANQFGPQSVDVTLSPGQTEYYAVNGDCEVDKCE